MWFPQMSHAPMMFRHDVWIGSSLGIETQLIDHITARASGIMWSL